MKYCFLVIGLLLCYLNSYSQPPTLKHVEGNVYVNKTDNFKIESLEAHITDNYDELRKDEKEFVRTVVLNLENDTLAILDNDSKGIKYRLHFNEGKRGMVEMRNDKWDH